MARREPASGKPVWGLDGVDVALSFLKNGGFFLNEKQFFLLRKKLFLRQGVPEIGGSSGRRTEMAFLQKTTPSMHTSLCIERHHEVDELSDSISIAAYLLVCI